MSLYLIQLRKPHGAYRAVGFETSVDAAVWCLRQHDVADNAHCTLRITDAQTGRVVVRAVPKGGAQ